MHRAIRRVDAESHDAAGERKLGDGVAGWHGGLRAEERHVGGPRLRPYSGELELDRKTITRLCDERIHA